MFFQKDLISENEMIKSLLEVQSALMESISTSDVNASRMFNATVEPK